MWATYDKEGMLGEAAARSSFNLTTILLGLLAGVILGSIIAFAWGASRSEILNAPVTVLLSCGRVCVFPVCHRTDCAGNQAGMHHQHQHQHQDHHTMDADGMVMNENTDQPSQGLRQNCQRRADRRPRWEKIRAAVQRNDVQLRPARVAGAAVRKGDSHPDQ